MLYKKFFPWYNRIYNTASISSPQFWKLSSELEARLSDGLAHQPPCGVLLWALSLPAPWPCGLE